MGLDNNWKKCKLGDVIEINYGKSLPKPKRVNGNVPVYSSSGITGWHNKALINSKGIIVGRKGTVGNVYFSDRPFYCIDTAFFIKPNDTKQDFTYIYYLLKSLPLKYLNTDSAVPGLNKENALSQSIVLPDINIQKSIANILSKLDRRIEINNRINQNLEAMAQAIFKHWFVDFEFPDENGNPYKSSGGEMVKSEMGLIPKGWEIFKISSIIHVRDGTHDSPKPIKEGHPLITSKHLMGTKLDFQSANKISENEYIEINKRSKVDRYDILISMIGTVGNLYLVQDEQINFAIKNIGLFKTSEKLGLYEYIYCYLNSQFIKNYIQERIAGSTQKYISLGELRKIPILIPNNKNIALINRFKKLLNPIFNKGHSCTSEIENLIKIRDTLLPKLMSGEIRVPTEQMVR